MTNTLLDLSGKIDKVAVSALGRIHQITSSMCIPFIIVGATARDILLEVHYGIRSNRATVDIDIAVFIENWDLFKHLKDELIGASDFTPTRDIQRLLFKKQLPVDIVPFGGVAEKGDLIEWPPDGSFKMSVTGFRECYQHAVKVKISDKSKLYLPYKFRNTSYLSFSLTKFVGKSAKFCQFSHMHFDPVTPVQASSIKTIIKA
jgi:predicted nucleotidyltransferase